MSERLSFTAGDKEYEMTPENAFLVRYKKLGEGAIRAAMYDHVLLTGEETVYAWLDPYGDEYKEEVQQIMLAEGFVAMLNMPDVEDKVIRAYDQTIIASSTKDLENGIPEAWL